MPGLLGRKPTEQALTPGEVAASVQAAPEGNVPPLELEKVSVPTGLEAPPPEVSDVVPLQVAVIPCTIGGLQLTVVAVVRAFTCSVVELELPAWPAFPG